MKTTRKQNLLAAALVGALAFTSARAADITPAEAHAIGVDAYIYFYPLVTMDVTRKQFTNIKPGEEFGKGPMNMFVNVPAYPPADLKVGCSSELRYALFPCVAGSHPRAGSGGVHAYCCTDPLCLDHRAHQDGRTSGLPRSA